MKKILFLALFLLSVITLSAKKPAGYSGLYSTTSHWSLDVSGGLNLFDGDIPQSDNNVLPSANLGAAFGVGVNYQFTAIYGLYVDYNYFSVLAQTKTWDIKTRVNMGAINASVNLLNLVSPNRESKFNFYGSIGLGLAKYFYHGTVDPKMPLNYGVAVTVPISLFCTYDVSDHFSLGGKMSYVSFNTDNLEGINYLNYKGVSNDRIESGTFFVRYNF